MIRRRSDRKRAKDLTLRDRIIRFGKPYQVVKLKSGGGLMMESYVYASITDNHGDRELTYDWNEWVDVR